MPTISALARRARCRQRRLDLSGGPADALQSGADFRPALVEQSLQSVTGRIIRCLAAKEFQHASPRAAPNDSRNVAWLSLLRSQAQRLQAKDMFLKACDGHRRDRDVLTVQRPAAGRSRACPCSGQ